MDTFFKRVYPDQQMAPLRRSCQGLPQVKGHCGVEEAVQRGVNNSLCIAEEKLCARLALERA